MSCSQTLVTEEDVRPILPTSTLLTSSQIKSAIEAASCIISRISEPGACGESLSKHCLTQVHIYLSAHFAAATENTLSLSSEKSGCSDSSASYGFVFGTGIKGTPFGQMANMLSGGCLSDQDKGHAMMFSIGSAGDNVFI